MQGKGIGVPLREGIGLKKLDLTGLIPLSSHPFDFLTYKKKIDGDGWD